MKPADSSRLSFSTRTLMASPLRSPQTLKHLNLLIIAAICNFLSRWWHFPTSGNSIHSQIVCKAIHRRTPSCTIDSCPTALTSHANTFDELTPALAGRKWKLFGSGRKSHQQTSEDISTSTLIEYSCAGHDLDLRASFLFGCSKDISTVMILFPFSVWCRFQYDAEYEDDKVTN